MKYGNESISLFRYVDQARIQRRMLLVIKMRDAGHDLDQGTPFPLDVL